MADKNLLRSAVYAQISSKKHQEKFFRINQIFELSRQISTWEIGVRFLQGFELSGNSDSPHSELAVIVDLRYFLT